MAKTHAKGHTLKPNKPAKVNSVQQEAGQEYDEYEGDDYDPGSDGQLQALQVLQDFL